MITKAKEHWPELSGFATAAIIFLMLSFGSAEISPAVIANCASLVAQVMATVLGLILTAYLVFHGMNIGESLKRLDIQSEEVLTEIKGILRDLHGIFIYSVLVACVGTIVPIAIYFVASLSGQIELIHDSIARFLNNLSFSAMFGILVAGILNLVAAVQSLYHLKDLED